MEEQLIRMEEKMDMLIKEVIGLKKRLNNLSHMPRDKPLPISEQHLRSC